jgi:hypothetical protein
LAWLEIGSTWLDFQSSQGGVTTAPKEQGRERSITQAALPAPDIEIGSRRPVNCILPGHPAGECDPLHKGREKAPGRALGAGDSHAWRELRRGGVNAPFG